MLSDLPVSLIVVGMGNGDLDYLDKEINSRENIIRDRHGKIITRDFIQCASYNNSGNKLAEHVLQSIPD
jgi:hypothetical protein